MASSTAESFQFHKRQFYASPAPSIPHRRFLPRSRLPRSALAVSNIAIGVPVLAHGVLVGGWSWIRYIDRQLWRIPFPRSWKSWGNPFANLSCRWYVARRGKTAAASRGLMLVWLKSRRQSRCGGSLYDDNVTRWRGIIRLFARKLVENWML